MPAKLSGQCPGEAIVVRFLVRPAPKAYPVAVPATGNRNRLNVLNRVIIVMLLACMIGSTTAQARDLYVAVDGNDAWYTKGTVQDPFASIWRATWPNCNAGTVCAQPSDTIYLRGGVYRFDSVQWIGTSGTQAKPILITAAPGERAILDGSVLGADQIISSDQSHIVIDGLEFRHAPGKAITFWASAGQTVLDITIRNNKISSCEKAGIYIGRDRAESTSISEIAIEGNIVTDTVLENEDRTEFSGWHPAVGLDGVEHGVVIGNEVYRNYGEGISAIRSSNVSVIANTVYDNFSVNLYIHRSQQTEHARNLVFSSDIVNYCRYFEYARTCLPAVGVMIANELDGTFDAADNTIVNNVFVNTRAGFYYGDFDGEGGSHPSKGLQDVVFAHNTVYQDDSQAAETLVQIDAGIHERSSISDNVFVHLAGQESVKLRGAMAGVAFINNLWFDRVPALPAHDPSTDILADPDLVAPQATDDDGGPQVSGLAPRDRSPAVSAGSRGTEVQTDFFGLTRPNPLTLGAIEYALDGLECSRAAMRFNAAWPGARNLVASEATVTLGGDAGVGQGATVFAIASTGVSLEPGFRVERGGALYARLLPVSCRAMSR